MSPESPKITTMNAYLINGTEFYAAADMPEAMDHHCAITNDNHGTIDSVEKVEASMKWVDPERPDETTIGHVLLRVTEPGYLGSSEA
jgi:hypothetical protein